MKEGAAKREAERRLADEKAHAEATEREAHALEEYMREREAKAAQRAHELAALMEDHDGDVPTEDLGRMSGGDVKDAAAALEAEAEAERAAIAKHADEVASMTVAAVAWR